MSRVPETYFSKIQKTTSTCYSLPTASKWFYNGHFLIQVIIGTGRLKLKAYVYISAQLAGKINSFTSIFNAN